ncbi:MAG: hypothetical protein AB7O45_02770 [Alphaproteobacteria bacterium]
MATVQKFFRQDEERVAPVNGRFYVITRVINVVSGDCPQDDNIRLVDIPPYHQVVPGTVCLRQSATLGASATATLRLGTTALTAATGAGGADSEAGVMTALPPYSTSADQELNILISGAAITASATLTVIVGVVDLYQEA